MLRTKYYSMPVHFEAFPRRWYHVRCFRSNATTVPCCRHSMALFSERWILCFPYFLPERYEPILRPRAIIKMSREQQQKTTAPHNNTTIQPISCRARARRLPTTKQTTFRNEKHIVRRVPHHTFRTCNSPFFYFFPRKNKQIPNSEKKTKKSPRRFFVLSCFLFCFIIRVLFFFLSPYLCREPDVVRLEVAMHHHPARYSLLVEVPHSLGNLPSAP